MYVNNYKTKTKIKKNPSQINMYINADPPALMSLQCTLRTIHLRMNSQGNRHDAVERPQYEAHDTSLKDSYSIHNLVLMVHKISVYIFPFFIFYSFFIFLSGCLLLLWFFFSLIYCLFSLFVFLCFNSSQSLLLGYV